MLSGKKILEEINLGNIKISPFNEENLNPNSYDLTLGEIIFSYKDSVLDVKKRNEVYREIMNKDSGYLLTPNKIYIANTVEYTESGKYIPMIEGKSSLARLGLSIHATAGFGDIGYKGVWTLELSCIQPIIIYPGMKIAQIYYNSIEGEYDEYSGKYQNSFSGTPSLSFKDFSDDSLSLKDFLNKEIVKPSEKNRDDELLKAKSLEDINFIFEKYKINSYPERINILEKLLHSEPIKFFDNKKNIDYKKRYESVVVAFLDTDVRMYRGIL